VLGSGREHVLELLSVAGLSAGAVAELVNYLPALLPGEVLQLAKLVFSVLPLVAGAHSAVDCDLHSFIIYVDTYLRNGTDVPKTVDFGTTKPILLSC
jgi:hypothetical protein